MAVNPDPRPGRWVLPLVVLGMVVFAYVFVRSLPGAEADGGDLGASETTTTTTVADGEDGGDGTTTETTTTTTPLDPEAAAYLDALGELEGRIIDLQTEMATINGQWDAEPREIEFAEARDALANLADRVGTWAGEVAELTPPDGLADTHSTATTIAQTLAEEANAVVEGLEAPDTGELRRAAVGRFDEAVRAFTAAVDEAEQVAETLGGGDPADDGA